MHFPPDFPHTQCSFICAAISGMSAHVTRLSLAESSNEICILQIVVAQCIYSCICIRSCIYICICDNQFASIYIIYAAQILLAIKAIQMSFVMHRVRLWLMDTALLECICVLDQFFAENNLLYSASFVFGGGERGQVRHQLGPLIENAVLLSQLT